ncbi:ADP-ribosylglycohydrolase family protein [Azospirillum ramasamyi]|nr:ADP-ribosylglycohydrolase family protein [Azospirillum ramasamyi]
MRRIGEPTVRSPVKWRRKVFSRGPVVDLPAGTYSDDTQLRLSVCRATRATGQFDVEAFAKIELPVWLSYSLGAGRGATAAATNLSKPSANWFSNYFESGERGYFTGGGNGAAMRIQPHVWKHPPQERSKFLRDVLKDALVTHGHAHGFCGAVFHALCVNYALSEGRAPNPDFWIYAVRAFSEIEVIVNSERQLRNIWLPTWQERSRVSLSDALAATIKEAVTAIEQFSRHKVGAPEDDYVRFVHALDLQNEKVKGSGLLTAIAAAALAWLFRNESVEAALLTAANAIHTDTDTIATMAGAIMGAARPDDKPKWIIQDKEYIVDEATRMAKVAAGYEADSFSYPDLLHWSPPETQADAVVRVENDLALRGLGRLTPIGNEVEQGAFLWQWMRIDFGQTVLAKRRSGAVPVGVRNWLPVESIRQSRAVAPSAPESNNNAQQSLNITQASLPFASKSAADSVVNVRQASTDAENYKKRSDRRPVGSIDELTQEAIKSGFDPYVVGTNMMRIIRSRGSVEDAIAFAAIIAKAVISRDKR